MVSLFPDLLAFALLAPAILRLFVGIYFLIHAARIGKATGFSLPPRKEHGIALISFAGALLVLAGLFTQPAAIALALVSLYEARAKEHRPLFMLLFAVSLSLIFTGPGFFAFDLPL